MLRLLTLVVLAVVEDSLVCAAGSVPDVSRFDESDANFVGGEKLFSAGRFFGALYKWEAEKKLIKGGEKRALFLLCNTNES